MKLQEVFKDIYYQNDILLSLMTSEYNLDKDGNATYNI